MCVCCALGFASESSEIQSIWGNKIKLNTEQVKKIKKHVSYMTKPIVYNWTIL